MTTLEKEFRLFMSYTYPGVSPYSPQWTAMELVWNSSAVLALGIIQNMDPEVGAEQMINFRKEAIGYCERVMKQGARNELN